MARQTVCIHDGTRMRSNPYTSSDLFWCPKCGGHDYKSVRRNGHKPAAPQFSPAANTLIDVGNATHYMALACDSGDAVNVERFNERAAFYGERALQREWERRATA